MGEGPDNRRIHFGIIDLLLLTAATGLWATVFLSVRGSFLVGPTTIAISLSGITIALHTLFRGQKHSWALSAIFAPVIAGLCLIVAAIISNRS